MEAVKTRGREFSYSHTLGNVSMFRYPVSLSLDAANNIYVLNRGHDGDWIFGVIKMTLDEAQLGKFGGEGQTDGRFIWPTSVVVDSRGRAYVSDEWLNRITVFDAAVDLGGADVAEGNFLSKWGVGGSAPGQLGSPAGMALDSDENLYVTEQANHRVSKFTLDGRHLDSFGGPGAEPGRFNKPWGVTVDAHGDLYVADWGNHRVQKLSPQGASLAIIGEPGAGPGKLHHPSDVAVDADGDVYVTDWSQSKVEVYDNSGEHLATLLGGASKLSRRSVEYLDLNTADAEKRALVTNFAPELPFKMPTAILIDHDGRIVIADNIRMRLQVYTKTRA